MAQIRQVNEVAILEFDGDALTDLMVTLRAHVDGDEPSARTILVDLQNLQELSADGIETLTEAAIVCRERGCDIGMFSLHEDVWRLLDALELAPHLPRVLPGDEDSALAQLEEEAVVPPLAAAPALPESPALPEPLPDTAETPALPTPLPASSVIPPDAPTPAEGIDLEITFDAATAPTARFGPIPSGPEAYIDQPSEELLQIDWGDLVKTGYQISGTNAQAIHAAVAAEEAVPKPPVEEAYSPLDTGDLDTPPPAVSRAAEQPDTRPMVPPRVETPPAAETPATAPAQQHPAVTAYAESSGDGDDQGTLMFQPGADFAAQLAAATQGGAPEAQDGQATGGGDDQGTMMLQPNAALMAELEQASQDLERSQSREIPPAAAAPGQQEQPSAFVEASDEGDQTVMFQPGLDLAAELARLEAADAAAAAAASPAAAAISPEVAEFDTEQTLDPAYLRNLKAQQQQQQSQGDEEEQTIMFQPGALDAALLAEVAAAAGPEQIPDDPPVSAPPPALEQRQEALGLNGTHAELKVFVHDYALTSALHLELLDRFAQAGERPLGPADLRSPGKSGGRVTDVVDQFVQCKLVRRTRAPRVRGGMGFLFSPSPKVHGLVKQLLQLWQAPQSRSTVSTWLES